MSSAFLNSLRLKVQTNDVLLAAQEAQITLVIEKIRLYSEYNQDLLEKWESVKFLAQAHPLDPLCNELITFMTT